MPVFQFTVLFNKPLNSLWVKKIYLFIPIEHCRKDYHFDKFSLLNVLCAPNQESTFSLLIFTSKYEDVNPKVGSIYVPGSMAKQMLVICTIE